MGCLSSFWSSKSAGGQLEQPSEVNSSTTTEVSELAFATDLGAEFSAKRKAAIVKTMRVNRCMLVPPPDEKRVRRLDVSRCERLRIPPGPGKTFCTTETQRHREIQKKLCDSVVKRGRSSGESEQNANYASNPTSVPEIFEKKTGRL